MNLNLQSFGKEKPPFIIAEMSGNHNQSLERALKIIDEAAASGVNAIKLQTYKANTITLDCSSNDFVVLDPNSLWKHQKLYNLYEQAFTPWEWHEALFKRSSEKGIICFSSPFDITAVDFLEKLENPIYKIASFEVTDLQLVKKIASTKKPVIASTGMASLSEIDEMVRTLRHNGCPEITLLKCTSTYPAQPRDTNLLTISHMKNAFNTSVGLSDHTLGIGVAIASVALGASIIEKHFTLSRADGGVDSTFSMEPNEMKMLVSETQRAWQALGEVKYGCSGENEEKSKKYRRSLYASSDIKKGEVFTDKNIQSVRPSFGLPTKFFEDIIGHCAKCNIAFGTPLNFEHIDW